jgi:hypothetical protein
MNLNQLWSGNDYAYYDMRGRGEVYRTNAQRVRIVRVYRERRWGNERLSGYAEVLYLNDDGTQMLTHKGEPRRQEVRARDIAMRWEEYEDERDHREAERERIQREKEEAQAREQDAKTHLLDKMVEKYGIPREIVTSIGSGSVTISRAGLERSLGLEQ